MAAAGDADAAIALFGGPPMPPPMLSFDGLSNRDNTVAYELLFTPADMIGDVGPSHYVQAVNVLFQVFSKAGTPLTQAIPLPALFAPLNTPCSTSIDGQPNVVYDPLADRWLISQFALPGGNQGFFECIAVSRSPDPVGGGWFLYAFPTTDGTTGNPVFPDYPKIAVWPDAYYMGTQRGFPGGGLDVWAYERDRMLVGAPAGVVQFSIPAPSLFLLPSDLDGPPPPVGTPNFFARQVDGERFGVTRPPRLSPDFARRAAAGRTIDARAAMPPPA